MRKIIFALALMLPIAGCITAGDVVNGVQLATTGIPNPITKDTLYDLENVAIITFSGLGAYKKSCANGALPASCKDVVGRLQVYTRKLPPILVDLRAFVKNNDQVDAVKAYATAKQIIADFKTVAIANNVKVQ